MSCVKKIEYQLIEATGVKEFNELLKSMVDNGWSPYMNVTITHENGLTQYNLLMMYL